MAARGRENVARIAYASQSRVAGPVYAQMERIRAAAMRHNVPLGVHTALLYQSGWFVQWKEGPGEALLGLMDRVAQDARHRDMRIVHCSRGPRLLDGPWSMAIVQCDDPPEEMAERVQEVRAALDAGGQLSPATVWRRLSTPLRHPGARRQGDADAFQRVLVCSASGTVSFDLVQWLAQRHRQELVHRRFAGAHDLDVATDYVDFEEGDRVMRVIAMARRGLEMPLTRAFLPDYSHALLLLSGERQRDLALLHRLSEALARQPRAPALVAIAARAEDHHEPFAAARRAGLIYLATEGDPASPLAAWQAAQPQLDLWRHAADSGWPLVPLRRLAAA